MNERTGMRMGGTIATLALLAFGGLAHGQAIAFQDDFDAGTSAGAWEAYSAGGDYTVDFAYDYSSRGIPAAPHSAGGTTVGLRLAVNVDGVPAVDGVSLYPTGQTFTGDHTLKFDMWLHYNGPAGGGMGSTEFATAGLLHGGGKAVWASNPASDGHWFAVTGEGGAAEDYRAYRGGTLLGIDEGVYAAVSRNHNDAFYQTFFTSPPFETQGVPGKQWVEVEIAVRGGVLAWRIDGRLMAVRYEPGLSAGNVMLGLMDTYASIANPVEDNFVIFDNVRVEVADCNGNGAADVAELAAGTALDCNCNGVPDDCENLDGGDFDVDGDVDLGDFAAFVACVDGVGSPMAGCAAACLEAFDHNGNATVDLPDYAAFQRQLTRGVFPSRPAAALTGSQVFIDVAGQSYTGRESRLMAEITGGNVPGFLRTFTPVTVHATIGGIPTEGTFFVTPDYLCVGVDRDFVRTPLTPLAAQPIADALGCLLPTRKMVDAIHAQAAVKLSPAPISPSTTDIMRATTQYRHHQTVEAQRAGQPLGALIAGIKKDVVITPLLATNPGKVAIYGWHYPNGSPIQPLYLGHVDWYVDYSHGIRLVKDVMLVDGVAMPVADVLNHPTLHVLLSDEGPIADPRY